MRVIAKLSLLLWFATLLVAVGVTWWSRHAPETPRPLYAAVLDNWRDLREQKYGTAYQKAALSVQKRFSQTEYEGMARELQGVVRVSTHIEFGRTVIASDRAGLEVFLVDANENAACCLYLMVFERGAWHVAATRYVRVACPGVLPTSTRS